MHPLTSWLFPYLKTVAQLRNYFYAIDVSKRQEKSFYLSHAGQSTRHGDEAHSNADRWCPNSFPTIQVETQAHAQCDP